MGNQQTQIKSLSGDGKMRQAAIGIACGKDKSYRIEPYLRLSAAKIPGNLSQR
ncbi:MAG: hypothetical protein AAGD09_17635 [Cyanobacteria bacterium P01_F01_bin.56]